MNLKQNNDTQDDDDNNRNEDLVELKSKMRDWNPTSHICGLCFLEKNEFES